MTSCWFLSPNLAWLLRTFGLLLRALYSVLGAYLAAMATSLLARAGTVTALLGCAALGAYGTLVTGSRNGLFDSISRATGAGGAPYYPGGPTPYRTEYTGIEPVDKHLAFLVTFFTLIIDGPQTRDVALSYWYLMAHFGAGMCLLLLEGCRKGNQWRAVSWYFYPPPIKLAMLPR